MPFSINTPVVALIIAVIGAAILLVILIWYIVMRSTYKTKVYAKIIDTARRPIQDKKKKKELTPQEKIEILKKGDPLHQVTYQYSPIYEYEYQNKNFRTPSGFYSLKQNMFKLNTVKKIYIDPHNPDKLLDFRFYRANILRAGMMGMILIGIAVILILYFR